MKKNTLTLVLLILLGVAAGTLVGQMLAAVPAFAFITKPVVDISWQPKADLIVLKYDLQLWVKLNLISIVGIAAAIWIYRRL
ncbi:DUF4321 domain-containing protein [Paenibacillus hamazuiensis]|uniref:DUF4321 domain-containing protein n=1 Tax=Paenibacillus hamazuiensis TaxID=2936508 RepID=UPI00200F84B1|nr:DUF4321 domain-containing protein [Paenibacillus hamazuiensis]